MQRGNEMYAHTENIHDLSWVNVTSVIPGKATLLEGILDILESDQASYTCPLRRKYSVLLNYRNLFTFQLFNGIT